MKSIEFQNRLDDFERWIHMVLHDHVLVEQLEKIRSLNLKEIKLRKSIVEDTEERLEHLNIRTVEDNRKFSKGKIKVAYRRYLCES